MAVNLRVGIIKCQPQLINKNMKNGGNDPQSSLIPRSASLDGQILGGYGHYCTTGNTRHRLSSNCDGK